MGNGRPEGPGRDLDLAKNMPRRCMRKSLIRLEQRPGIATSRTIVVPPSPACTIIEQVADDDVILYKLGPDGSLPRRRQPGRPLPVARDPRALRRVARRAAPVRAPARACGR